MYRKSHGVAADYFALGVIAFECMIGKFILIFFITLILKIIIKRDLILEKIEKKLKMLCL